MLRRSSDRYYIGSTTNLERRLQQHRLGQTHTTRRLGQRLELIISVEVGAIAGARALERQLKQKKNPRLALFHLEKRGQPVGG